MKTGGRECRPTLLSATPGRGSLDRPPGPVRRCRKTPRLAALSASRVRWTALPGLACPVGRAGAVREAKPDSRGVRDWSPAQCGGPRACRHAARLSGAQSRRRRSRVGCRGSRRCARGGPARRGFQRRPLPVRCPCPKTKPAPSGRKTWGASRRHGYRYRAVRAAARSARRPPAAPRRADRRLPATTAARS